MPPAARISDHRACPHAGGPILPTGCKTVLVGGQPAARAGDKARCSHTVDSITQGEPTVLIGGAMAARMGDPTAHGVIVQGEMTVCIGSNPACD